jgi:CDP-diacylglycerol---serine O-phosphatidyltransferase
MIRKNIPNLITCLNVASGSIAVVLAIKGELTLAVLFIFAAAIFDFFDGMAARLLKAYSPIGKELDSLADMISFGLAPGMLMMVMQEYALFGKSTRLVHFTSLSLWEITCISSALLIPVMSALRLAKFNIDTRQTHSFVGLPTPSSALLIAALALITEHGKYAELDMFLLQPVVLLVITLATSFLLVSELPMFSLKLKNLSWQENRVQFIFLFISVSLISISPMYGIAGAIISYILISFILRLRK